MREREDWETPDIKKPARLTKEEAEIIYKEINRGASEHALADYFGTSVRIVRQAYSYMRMTNNHD